MTYKKANWIHQNYFRPENSRKFVESAAILMKLKYINFKLVYFDEFKINMKNEKSYTWSKIGKRGYIKRSVIESQYSSIIAFWQDHIYDIRPNDETNNSSDSLAFINDYIVLIWMSIKNNGRVQILCEIMPAYIKQMKSKKN